MKLWRRKPRRTFRDNRGREWVVDVTKKVIRHWRKELGVDVERGDGQVVLSRLASDPVLLVAVIHAACEADLKAAGVGPEDFGAALVGQPIVDATDALLLAMVDAMPGPERGRAMLRRAIEVKGG